MKNFTRFLALMLLVSLMAITLVECKYTIHEQLVNATVTDMKYVPSYSHYGYYMGEYKLLHEKEKYYVTLKYGKVTKKIESSSIYNSVNVGDYVEVTLITKFNRLNKIVSQELSK